MHKYINFFHLTLILSVLLTSSCTSSPWLQTNSAALFALSANDQKPVLNTASINPEVKVPRSMWIWKTHLALNEAEQDRLLEFCQLRHIERLFLYTGKEEYFANSELRKQLVVFITKAHAQGIFVEALDGWPEAIYPEFHHLFLDSLQRVLDFNRSVPAEARFAGFQSDIEPKGLPGYYSDSEARKNYDELFLQLHQKCQVVIDDSGDNAFTFGIALSPRYDDNPIDHQLVWEGKQGRVPDHMIHIVDYFAIMSYSDSGQSTIQLAEYEIELGNRWEKPVWVGCETLDVFSKNLGPKSITFAEEGLDYMEQELAIVSRRFKDEKSFAGIAIHCYDPYRHLQSDAAWDDNYLVNSAQSLPTDAVVDGNLDDWSSQYTLTTNNIKNVIYGKNDWQGPEDLSSQVRFGWTPESLRIAVNVYDDKLVQLKPHEMMWEGDHIEVWLHAPALDRIYQFGFTPGDFATMNPHCWLWYPKALDADSRSELIDQLTVAAVRHHERGYLLECDIPVDFFGLQFLKADMEFRISVEIGDADDPEKPHETLLSISPAFNKNRPTSFALITLAGE